MSATRIIRADSPEREQLEQAGWQVTARSWGAQLNSADVSESVLRSAIEKVEQSIVLRPLHDADLDAVLSLDGRTAGDYPGGPATRHRALDREAAELGDRRRGFGAFEEGGQLVAMTYLDVEGCTVETDFTVVAPEARGRGLATAVKAASVFGLLSEGVTRFRTGGSDENPGIIASNQRLGYVRDEEWVTLQAPNDSG